MGSGNNFKLNPEAWKTIGECGSTRKNKNDHSDYLHILSCFRMILCQYVLAY